MILRPRLRWHWVQWLWWGLSRRIRRRWNRLRGKREVFCTMEWSAKILDPDGIVQIKTEDEE